MKFIDVFDFSKYFKKVDDTKRAKIGHINAVIEEVNNFGLKLNFNKAAGNNFDESNTVSFTKTNFGTEVDVIIPGQLELTRGNNKGLFNIAVESSYDNDLNIAPADTEWNSYYTDSTNYGFENLENVKDRIYDTWFHAVTGQPPVLVSDPAFNNEPQLVIMHHIPTDRYFGFQFTQWTENNGGGGFSYMRAEILFDPLGYIKFSDDTIQYTAYKPIYPGIGLVEVPSQDGLSRTFNVNLPEKFYFELVSTGAADPTVYNSHNPNGILIDFKHVNARTGEYTLNFPTGYLINKFANINCVPQAGDRLFYGASIFDDQTITITQFFHDGALLDGLNKLAITIELINKI